MPGVLPSPKKCLNYCPHTGLPQNWLIVYSSHRFTWWAVGAVLSQEDMGKEYVVAYYCRQLSKLEKNYSTTEREILVVITVVKEFYPYLYGCILWLVMDHNPLTTPNSWMLGEGNPGRSCICNSLIINLSTSWVLVTPIQMHSLEYQVMRWPK